MIYVYACTQPHVSNKTLIMTESKKDRASLPPPAVTYEIIADVKPQELSRTSG